MTQRHCVQIAVVEETADTREHIFALCSDGSIWRIDYSSRGVLGTWRPLPPLPPLRGADEG